MIDERGLARAGADALAQTENEFRQAAGAKTGLERLFSSALQSSLARHFPESQISKELLRSKVSRPNYFMNVAKERIDIVIDDRSDRIGIEIKVCQLPRLASVSDNGSMYDLGGITWDYIRLSQADLTRAYCIIVVHGIIGGRMGTNGTRRFFHDSLFVDFCKSSRSGQFDGLADLHRTPAEEMRFRQQAVISELGFDHPYMKFSSALGKCPVSLSPEELTAMFVLPVAAAFP